MTGAMLHMVLELVSSALCASIAVLAWQRFRFTRAGVSLLWATGFALVAASDAVHAVLPAIYPSLATYWAPWTWAVGRVLLGGSLLIASTVTRKPISAWWVLPALAIGGGLMVAAFVPGSWPLEWVQLPLVVARPADLLLACVWLALWASFRHHPWALIQIPRGLDWFMFLGVIVHLTMAMASYAAYDGAFYFAHGLKVAEYGLWLVMAALEARAIRQHGDVEWLGHRLRMERATPEQILREVEDVQRTLADWEANRGTS